MTLYATVKDHVLKGLWPAEIRDRVQGTSERTVQQYCFRVMRELSDEERGKVELLRKHRPKPSSGGKQFRERRVVSQHHAILGGKIYYFRKCLDMPTQAFCEHFKFSNKVQLSAMEQGYHDFTLSELHMISRIMDFSVPKIMEQIENDLSTERLLPNYPRSPSAA